MAYHEAHDAIRSTQLARDGIAVDLMITYSEGKLGFHKSLVEFYSPELAAAWLAESKTEASAFVMNTLHRIMYGGLHTGPCDVAAYIALAKFINDHKSQKLMQIVTYQVVDYCKVIPALFDKFIEQSHAVVKFASVMVRNKILYIRTLAQTQKRQQDMVTELMALPPAILSEVLSCVVFPQNSPKLEAKKKYAPPYNALQAIRLACDGTPFDMVFGKLHFHKSLMELYAPRFAETKLDEKTADWLHVTMYGGYLQTTQTIPEYWEMYKFANLYMGDIFVRVMKDSILTRCRAEPETANKFILLAEKDGMHSILANLILVSASNISNEEKTECKTCTRSECKHADNRRKRRRFVADMVVKLPVNILTELLVNKLF